ncbi:MAG: FAD-dependent oxidoreductase [Dehalococcoidia bacterium]
MPKVFEPIKVGTMEVKNRIWSLPMVQNYADRDGFVTPKLIYTYKRRAEGGYGLVHVEASYMRQDGNGFFAMLGVYSDLQITGLREVADAIHEAGAKCALQPVHCGKQANVVAIKGVQPLAPSTVNPCIFSAPPRALTTKETEEIIEQYAECAARIKMAGFDTVLLHAAHGFLLTEFMSPYSNVGREDRFADHLTFITELVKKCREYVGPDWPIMMRINVDEMVPGGITPELSRRQVAALVEAGVDGFELTNSNFDSLEYNLEPIYWARGGRVDQLLQVRESTTVPLAVRGRINDPILVERIIEEGRADIVSVGRAPLADPDFPKKMQEGRYEDIRKCIACDWSCAWKLFEQVPIQCSVNYNYGKEYEEYYGPPPVRTPKRVMVVGGGPAGMECARVCAERGHKVTLYEKDDKLGGMVHLAAGTPRLNTADLSNIIDWLPPQLEKLGVEVRLNKEVTPADIEAAKPDAVVIATGSRLTVPAIPGANLPHVLSLEDYYFERKDVGQRVVVLGGQEGSEAAASLAREGKEVTLVSETATYADANYMYVLRTKCVSEYLAEGNVKIITEAKLKEITADGVRITDKEGGDQVLPADTVVYAVGRTPARELADALRGRPGVYEIGDCKEARRIHEAVHEGAALARQIN